MVNFKTATICRLGTNIKKAKINKFSSQRIFVVEVNNSKYNPI